VSPFPLILARSLPFLTFFDWNSFLLNLGILVTTERPPVSELVLLIFFRLSPYNLLPQWSDSCLIQVFSSLQECCLSPQGFHSPFPLGAVCRTHDPSFLPGFQPGPTLHCPSCNSVFCEDFFRHAIFQKSILPLFF